MKNDINVCHVILVDLNFLQNIKWILTTYIEAEYKGIQMHKLKLKIFGLDTKLPIQPDMCITTKNTKLKWKHPSERCRSEWNYIPFDR